jgi:hypothetical protein
MKHDWKLSKFVKHIADIGTDRLILCVSPQRVLLQAQTELMVSAAIS